MFKKHVALVSEAVLCLAMVSKALTSGDSGYNHTWEWQNGGQGRMLKYDNQYHREYIHPQSSPPFFSLNSLNCAYIR